MKIVKICSPVLLFLLALSITAHAQVPFPPDKDQLLKGEATGQTLVAEISGFPAPQKIISYKDQLGLSKDQLRKINEILTNLPISAIVKGQDVVEAEEGLKKLFESGDMNEKTLRANLERIGKMRAELRFMHLQVYVKEKQILSVKQWERLKELQASEVK
jgi:hypothetical protein